MKVKSLDGGRSPLREFVVVRVIRELKRKGWGCLLPRCLAA